MWWGVRYILSCLAHSLFKLLDLNPVSLVLRRWRQLHHMSTMMTLSIRPRLIDLATDFLLSDDRRKRKLLSWVKSILPRTGDDVVDFTACWQDGIVICSLIEAINPGACPRFGQLKPHHRVPNCRLGLQLAMQYLQVTQRPLCPEEMAIADDRTEVKICHLVQLLKWKYQKQGSKPTLFSILSVDNPMPCKCQARGTGIRAGIVGRRAKFNILAETATRLDLDIEIRGPNNEYNKEKIVSVDTSSSLSYRNQQLTPTAPVCEEDGKSKIIDDGAGNSFLRQKSTEEDTGRVVIPFDYQCVGEGRFLVTYIPRNAGLHYITVLSGGVHIPGSPFEVKVSDWVSSWNMVPRSRAVPIDMLHSAEEKQRETSAVSKDATVKIKHQLGQVAHMSQQLTRMKRRVLRKVIKANGEEIVCDVIPALTRQKSADQLLIEEDRLQREATEQTDNEINPPSCKHLHNGTVSDYNNEVSDISPRTETGTGDLLHSWTQEQQVKSELMTPSIVVTPDDECDDSDAYDVYIQFGTDLNVPDHPNDDLKDTGEPDSLEQAFLNKERKVFPSPTSRIPLGSSYRSTIHSSLEETSITTGLQIREGDFPKASSASRRSDSTGTLPILQDTHIPGGELEKQRSCKQECIQPANSNQIRSISVDDCFLQRGSHFGSSNMKPVVLGVLESTASPLETLFSFSVSEQEVNECQRNASPFTSIAALNSPKCHDSLQDFSLLQISPSKEGCWESGSREIAKTDHVNTHRVQSGAPTDNEICSSLHCTTDHNFEVSGSSVYPDGNLTNKSYTRNQTDETQNSQIVSYGNSNTGIWSLHCTTDQSIGVDDSTLSPFSNFNDKVYNRNRSHQTDNPQAVYSGKPTDSELWSSPHCITDQRIEINGSSLYPVGDVNDEIYNRNLSDQTNNSQVVYSGKPTNELCSLHCTTDQSITVNGSSVCRVGNFIDKMDRSELDNRHYVFAEKVSHITSVQHQTDVKETAHGLDFNHTHEVAINKNRVSRDVSWASNISSWVNTEHWPAFGTSSSCDMHDFSCEPSLYKNVNARGKLKRSWSDSYTDGNFDGKPLGKRVFETISADSAVHLRKPETELFCASSEMCSTHGTGCKELDRNQYKIEILNSDGFSKPYFCFKDSINCNDKTRIHESKLATENHDEIKGNQSLKNDKGDDPVSMRVSSGNGCSNSNKRNISDIDRTTRFDGCSALSHSNKATGEELYSDDDEILHIVIEPMRHSSHNEDIDNQESRLYTRRDIQTNDNLPDNLENHNKCPSVLEHTSPALCNENGDQMTRQQMEEINGVSPFSDLSKISGNSDWSDTDDAGRRFSESQKSKYTTGRYFLKGDWSPQFVELNYQGGRRSRRRSSTRSASSLSPSNCSHRTKHGTTSLRDGGDTDTDRIHSSLENGRRESDHIKVPDGNENPVKIDSLGNHSSGQSVGTAGTDLQNKIETYHKETSKHCISGNSDHHRSNIAVEITGLNGCKLYLRRRRKPVYIHEHSLDNTVGKDGLTNNSKRQHTQNIHDMKPYVNPQRRQKNTPETTSHCMPAFFSKMELLSPDLSDCLPVDNWSSLSNSWVDDLYEHSRCFSGGNDNLVENSNPSHGPYNTSRCLIEPFEARTLTPSKYRKREQVTRCAQNIQDKDEPGTNNCRFYSNQCGYQREWQGIVGHEGCVTGSGSTPVVLTYGDRVLTPTKYRRQTQRRHKSHDKPQMETTCQRDSNGSDVRPRRPVSKEANAFFFAGKNNTTQAQKQGQAHRQNTHGRLNTRLDLEQPGSSQDFVVSQIPISQPFVNRMHKYSEMRRGFRDNYSTENEREELREAFVAQSCSSDLCLDLPQDRAEDNKFRKRGCQIAEMRDAIDATKESTKHTGNTARDSVITNNHLQSGFQFSNSEALHFSSEPSLGDDLLQPSREHQKNSRQDPLYSSHISLENPLHHPAEDHQQNTSSNPLQSNHMRHIQNRPQFQKPVCPGGECLMHCHDQLHQKLQNETSSLRSPQALQQPIPDLLGVEKHGYPLLGYVQQEGVQQEHGDLQEELQQGQTTEWQEELNDSIVGYTKDSHRFGVRRQSTVETMDSGITEGSSLNTQLSYTETGSNCDLPDFDEGDFHMRLLLA